MRTRVWVAGGLGLLLLLLLGGVAGAGLYTRVSYGVWSPFDPPDRIQFCGVRYYQKGRAVLVTQAEAQRFERSEKWLLATTVELKGWQVYRTATWSCPEPEGRNGTGHNLYVRIGQDRYLAMDDQN